MALIKSFADQAVIAIENARLFEAEQQRTRELGELLEQQTATAEVLQVISTSPGELEPVFQAMLENATRICEAKFGVLYRFDGEAFHFAAEVGAPVEYAEFNRQRGAFQPVPGGQLDRVMLKERCVTLLTTPPQLSPASQPDSAAHEPRSSCQCLRKAI